MTPPKKENFNKTTPRNNASENSQLIVRNVSFNATEELLQEHFAKFGDITEVKLLKNAEGKLLGCGFVHFQEVSSAKKAMSSLNKKQFMGRPIRVNFATPKADDSKVEKTSNKRKLDEGTDSTTKVKTESNEPRMDRRARLIIRNISFKSTEDLLKKHFEPYGSVLEVKILKKPNGKLVGCAFIQYENFSMAKKAILNTNLKPFLGRPISVDWALAKDKFMRHEEDRKLEMEDQVKKEESSDDEDEQKVNLSDEVKAEVKSESDENSDKESVKSEESSDESDAEENESEDESDDQEMNSDNESQMSEAIDKRKKLNDAEDGCTVFIRNIPFSVDNDMLRKFAEKTGPVKYALICIDQMTEHSKGTGFVKFTNEEDAEKFLSLEADGMRLEGQVLEAKSALKKENVSNKQSKTPTDSRNLYLVKEGVIIAGSKAAVGVSASDMSKRLALERNKTLMLKNLNRFVSKYRLVVQNLPPHLDDNKLREICRKVVSNKAEITEARIMRDFRAPLGDDGKHPSKGFGFVMFMKHEDALTCLRKLNNNPDIFDKNNRPIVSFSLEDRAALNARKKRLEKSIANNPTANKTYEPPNKRQKKNDFNNAGKYVKPQDGTEKHENDVENIEYAGLTSKHGASQKLRNKFKLRQQDEIHRKNVKMEKKKSKKSIRLKMAAKERIKQPKMQQVKKQKKTVENTKPVKSTKDNRNFSELVSKYKSKLVSGGLERVKTKWYE